MSVQDTEKIDVIGIDRISDEVILTISDHLTWGVDAKNHLILLESKINTYLAFIESDELLESYPDARDRKPVINIVSKYLLNEEARGFLNQATPIIEEAGISLRFELLNT